MVDIKLWYPNRFYMNNNAYENQTKNVSGG